MKDFFREMNSAFNAHVTPVVKWTMYVLTAMFILGVFVPVGLLFFWLGVHFSSTILQFRLWQIFTYPLVDDTVWHLFFDLMTLFYFGSRLEDRWGSERFIKFGIFVIVGAALITFAINAIAWSAGFLALQSTPLMGTAPFVLGIVMVYAMYYPESPVYVFGIFPVKAKYLVLIYAVAELLFYREMPSLCIGNLAGLFCGFLFARYIGLFDRVSLPKFSRSRKPQSFERGRWRDL